MNQQIVEPGKIITILFNSPFSKPLEVVINNKGYQRNLGIVYISPKSPLAQALLNRKLGDKVEFDSPDGKLKIRILGIS